MASNESDRHTNQTLLVGFHSAKESAGALRWAVERVRSTGGRVVVIHATTAPVAITNGPSAAMSQRLGNPTWATVHSAVAGLDALDFTTTKVQHGRPADVLAEHVADADLVVLGPKRRGWFRTSTTAALERATDRTIVRIDDERWLEPTVTEADQNAVLTPV